jgi:hypothetical protein
VSRHVSDRAACPWRLYYTRYYTGAAIHTSQPAGTPIERILICHSAPRIRDQRIWPRGITVGCTSGRPSTGRDALAPHAIQLADIGSMYLFTRTTCQNRPLDGGVQMT